ncbi:helix-turn-helix transcriptional regulator [Halomonas sp. MCCC 1A11036]|uniref:Helix-turn-helix transcriptional regulator n=1 Tax=Billgrantia zhangzhouensis TaxID=2733481 RepID=A0ABS9AIW1_9GAMM|nr:helix-turn-helix transcriptional regulator [Halomonas zhangzhouensis]MCE8021580.1 helix-turn-helix transcriptional regulator [Halomonas zhangzhouensis]
MTHATPLPRDELQRRIESAPGPVQPYACDYPAGWDTGLHHHVRTQLVFATHGVMTVSTPAGRWMVPPQLAVWIPARQEHALLMHRAVKLRTLYLDERLPGLPTQPRVINVSPLLRELILRLMELPAETTAHGVGARLVAVLLDELHEGPTLPLHLPEPHDPALRRICDALRDDPANRDDLTTWGRTVGASPRTLARRFQAQTGMGFAAWRQQARLLAALPLLAEGHSVTAVAQEVGYESTSAFIAAFRRSLGTSPGRYFSRPPEGA